MEPMFTNWAGYGQNDFSYSLASDIDKCGHYTKLTRIQGLTTIAEKAVFKFGSAVEAALVHNYQTGGDPEEHFGKLWQFFADKNMEYGERDGNWNGLLIKGRGLMREFLAQKANLPDLSKAVFGQKLTLSNWMPRANLVYIADAWTETPEGPLLIDIKTAAAGYPEDAENYPADPEKRWLAMDPQLRTGCLVSGIRRVGFLVLVKTKQPRIQYLEAKVKDELVEDIDSWLRDQYERILAKKFNRRSGWRFPMNHCTMCDVSSACLGNEELATQLLKRRETKEFESAFE